MAGTINVGTIQVGGLKELKAELKAVRDELLNATDPKRMQELATAAGELKDRIGDANEQITVFASGSKFEQVSNSFGSLKDSIMNLDFEEAADKAKIFQTTVTSINPETISKGIQGLTSTVSTLGKTFIQFGVMLLTNPIFLLVAAITDLDNQNYDFVLVFEGDTIIDSDFNELYESLFKFNRIANEQNLDLVGFGNPKETTNINGPQIEDIHCDVIPFVPAQSYLIPQSKLENW